MDLSASRTVHGERKVERVENDHFSGEAGRHRHPEHWTPGHNVRHKWSLAEGDFANTLGKPRKAHFQPSDKRNLYNLR
jgi:hypothetical protein